MAQNNSNRFIVFDNDNSCEIVRLSETEVRLILLMRDTDEDKKIFDRIFGIKKL